MIDHYRKVTYLSECDGGHEFKWGYEQDARSGHVIEKSCECNVNWMRCIKERVEIDG